MIFLVSFISQQVRFFALQNFPRFTSPSSPAGQLLSAPILNSSLPEWGIHTVVCLYPGLICLHINSSWMEVECWNASLCTGHKNHQGFAVWWAKCMWIRASTQENADRVWMWWKNVIVCNEFNLSSAVPTLWKNKAILPALHNKLTMNKKMKKFTMFFKQC